MKIKSLLLMSFSLWLASETAFAGCTPLNGFENKVINFNFPASLTAKHGLPVNSVIHEIKLGTYGDVALCNGDIIQYGTWKGNVWGQTGESKIIETNIPGVGVELYYTADNSNFQFPFDVPYSGVSNFYIKYLSPSLRFIKTKEHITPGVITPGVIGTHELNRANSSDMYTTFTANLQSAVEIKAPSCEVQGDPNKVVSFGTVINKNLASISRDVPGTEREITIDLKCNPGTKVAVTYDSVNKDSYLQSSIINQGTAKGVYVLFLDNIGKLGQANTVITNSGEIETIKQRVVLYRSGTFSSGSISAQATYTLNYE
ncbi:fimbrial protein [Citrobacter freundii]|nr:fimbrial protein [Citrobacter freundii]